MDKVSEVLQVFNQQRTLVAKIVLNGYNIQEGGPLGQHGAMRSFKMIRGDLWDHWYQQQALILRGPTGQEQQVRVAALPVEDDSFGLIEFV